MEAAREKERERLKEEESIREKADEVAIALAEFWGGLNGVNEEVVEVPVEEVHVEGE